MKDRPLSSKFNIATIGAIVATFDTTAAPTAVCDTLDSLKLAAHRLKRAGRRLF